VLLAQLWKKRKRYKAIHLDDTDIGRRLRRSGLYLLAIFLLHTLLMMYFEGLTLGDALWLTLTTATTVGYGDYSASTTGGRLTTVILLYGGGIFVLANLAGEYLDSRADRKRKMIKGYWEWHMANHILIINTPAHGGNQYFFRLISQLRKNEAFAEIPIQILTSRYPTGLPQELRDLGVVHFTGESDNSENLLKAGAAEARALIILAKDEYETKSDALSFDILHRLAEQGINHIPIIAECVDDANRPRLEQAGATIVIRPVRAYAELVVRSLVAPGSEKIIENLFVHEGDHTKRYEIDISGLSWSDIVHHIMAAGFGTALAYINGRGITTCNPPPQDIVTGNALIIMVRANSIPNGKQIQDCLANARPKEGHAR